MGKFVTGNGTAATTTLFVTVSTFFKLKRLALTVSLSHLRCPEVFWIQPSLHFSSRWLNDFCAVEHNSCKLALVIALGGIAIGGKLVLLFGF